MQLDEALDILDQQEGNIIYELAEIGDNIVALKAIIEVATTYIHMTNYTTVINKQEGTK